jgi:hypothetical protein
MPCSAHQPLYCCQLTAGPPAACFLQGPGAYPGPLAELDFWSERAANLNAIHEQLSSERIQKVVKILELANSTYFQAFQRLYQVCAQPAR